LINTLGREVVERAVFGARFPDVPQLSLFPSIETLLRPLKNEKGSSLFGVEPVSRFDADEHYIKIAETYCAKFCGTTESFESNRQRHLQFVPVGDATQTSGLWEMCMLTRQEQNAQLRKADASDFKGYGEGFVFHNTPHMPRFLKERILEPMRPMLEELRDIEKVHVQSLYMISAEEAAVDSRIAGDDYNLKSESSSVDEYTWLGLHRRTHAFLALSYATTQLSEMLGVYLADAKNADQKGCLTEEQVIRLACNTAKFVFDLSMASGSFNIYFTWNEYDCIYEMLPETVEEVSLCVDSRYHSLCSSAYCRVCVRVRIVECVLSICWNDTRPFL
jgi:hypothetical protein